MKTYETLTEAIDDLKLKGYANDFNLHPEWIECPPLDLKAGPHQFHVDAVYRFEGMTNPDDSTVLYAISLESQVKGLLMDAYGVYAESISPDMLKALRIDSDTNPS